MGVSKRMLSYASGRDVDLLQTEFFLNYIVVASKRDEKEHCIIRLILSTLATPEEIKNLTKRDLKAGKFYSIRLFSKGKSRISPIDERTFMMVKKAAENTSSRNPIFRLSREEINEIVRKNSPPGEEYDAERLRSDVMKIISDNLFFEPGFDLDSSSLEKMYMVFQDSNPLYSGAWEVEDDLMLAEFLNGYNLFIGLGDIEKVAETIGEPVERLKKVLELTD
jgi:hypothetical protein